MNQKVDVTNSNTATVSESLSAQQRRLWVLEQLKHPSASHHVSVCLRVRGKLDVASLQQATQAVHDRHDVLHSSFAIEKDKPRAFRSPSTRASFATIDLTSLPENEREPSAQAQVAKELAQPFDLQTGPLSRTVLYRLAAEEHLYVLILHRIVCDSVSAALLSQEVAAAYASIVSATPLADGRSSIQRLRAMAGHAISAGNLVRTIWLTGNRIWPMRPTDSSCRPIIRERPP